MSEGGFLEYSSPYVYVNSVSIVSLGLGGYTFVVAAEKDTRPLSSNI